MFAGMLHHLHEIGLRCPEALRSWLAGRPTPNHVPRVLAVVSAGPCRDTLKRIFDEMGWVLGIADTSRFAADCQTCGHFGVVLYQRELTNCDWGSEVSRLARLSPRPCVILLSANAGNNLWDDLGRHGGSDILRTPVQRDAVIRAVQSGWLLWRNQQKLRVAADGDFWAGQAGRGN